MQQDNKRIYLKKYYVSLNEMASQYLALDSYYKATRARTNDYLWPTGNHPLSNYSNFSSSERKAEAAVNGN